MDQVQLENNFSFHPATETTGPVHNEIRAEFRRVVKWLNETLPEGRHKSLAMTSLEEAMHWSNASVACNQD